MHLYVNIIIMKKIDVIIHLKFSESFYLICIEYAGGIKKKRIKNLF